MIEKKRTFVVPFLLLLAGCYGDKLSSRVCFNPFKNVMGITEQEFKAVDSSKRQELSKAIKNYGGTFFLFKDRSKPTVGRPRALKFNVIEGTGDPAQTGFREKLDTPALQAAPENAGAVFQVASNFDCLEGGGGQQSKIMDYLSPGMYVQGESASISAMPGTIQRMYFNKPVNLLEGFSRKWNFNYSSGYVGYVPVIDQQFGNLTVAEIKKAAQDVEIGIQKDVCVTGGFGPTVNELATNCPVNEYLAVRIKPADAQRITQVFTAALNPYSNDTTSSGFRGLAQIFLHAGYSKTVHYSLEATDKLYLTLVGGGVFQNKIEWIADAITDALKQKVSSDLKMPLEINLIVYNSAGYKDRQDWYKAEKILQKLVSSTGGRWTRYSLKGEQIFTSFN